jgi:hypothetical protein
MPCDNFGKVFRRRRQVEQPVPLGSLLLVDPLEQGLQFVVAARVVEVHGEIAHFPHELVELFLALLHSSELENAFAHVFFKLSLQRPPGYANHRKFLRQQVRLLEMEESGQELALGQVAGSAEDDHDGWLWNPLGTLRRFQVFSRKLHFCGCHGTRSLL